MMRRISNPADYRLIAIVLTALLVMTAGCASNDVPMQEPVPTDTEFSDGMMQDDTAADLQDMRMTAADVKLPVIYFDLDSSEIHPEFRNALEAGAAALTESGASLLVEGNCDERGSDEYNMALGERRASAVRKYLFNLGVPKSQITIVSYGEARPAVSGHSEAAWRMNRRAEFRVR